MSGQIPEMLGSLAWAAEQSACNILETPRGNPGKQPWVILPGAILVGFLGAFLGYCLGVLGGLGQFLDCLVHWLGQSNKVLVESWKLQGAILDNNLGEFLGAVLEGSRQFLGELLGCCLGVS